MKPEYLFLEPVDVLYLRGNRLFGEAGDHAEAQMPPWPSLFAGAIRSRILVDRNVPLGDFAEGKVEDADIKTVLGTPASPGTFRVSFVSLCRKGNRSPEPLFPLPADLIAFEPGGMDRKPLVQALQPAALSALEPLSMSSALTSVPILRTPALGKPLTDIWLDRNGFLTYLRGGIPDAACLVKQSDLWETDARLGIALDAASRTAAQGRIYTSDAVALKENVGFLVGVSGSGDILPSEGLLRLGGDGRGAVIAHAAIDEAWSFVPAGPRFRMILSTPGLFPRGWLPPAIAEKDGHFLVDFNGFKARLLAAAVPRYRVVSGWNLAKPGPKPAERIVPTGSVYWFEKIEGDMSVLGEILEKGLWPLIEQDANTGAGPAIDPQRRAEGFNNIYLAEWK